MRLLVAIEAPDWNNQVVGQADQYRRTAFAKMLRDVADRVQIGGAEGTFERPDMSATFRMEIPADEPAADAA